MHIDGHGQHIHSSSVTQPFSWHCDGHAWSGVKGSTWATHITLGCVTLLWALHWAQGAFRAYVRAPKSYTARSCYSVPFAPEGLPVEAVLRTVLPVVGLVHQLFVAPGGFA